MPKKPVAAVKIYEGAEGIKQALWNQTKGISENLSLLHENMQTNTDQAFFEKWARQCNNNGLKFRSIIDSNFVTSQILWYVGHTNERLTHWEGRSIPSSKFPIPHSLVVYDDIVLHYQWDDGNCYAVEYHDAQLSRFTRQFFELLWDQAKPQKI